MKKQIIIIAFVLLMNIFLVCAEISFVFKQNEEVNFRFRCFDENNNYCSSSTQLQISIEYPNGSNAYDNSSMTYNETYFNHTLSTDSIGEYAAIIISPTVNGTISEFSYEVTPTGETLTTARGIIYILLAVLVFFLFVFVLYINIALPMGNEKNQGGQITKIIKMKYIKIALIPVTYSLFVWFLNLLLSISVNLTGRFNAYYEMFSFLFSSFISLSWVVFVVCLVWFMFNWIRDLHWNKQIKKFGRVIR